MKTWTWSWKFNWKWSTGKKTRLVGTLAFAALALAIGWSDKDPFVLVAAGYALAAAIYGYRAECFAEELGGIHAKLLQAIEQEAKNKEAVLKLITDFRRRVQNLPRSE